MGNKSAFPSISQSLKKCSKIQPMKERSRYWYPEFSQFIGAFFFIRFRFCGTSSHGKCIGFPINIHNLAKCSKLYLMRKAWKVVNHTLSESMGVSMISYVYSSHGKRVRLPTNIPQYANIH